jgi:hypothetical protein
MKDWKSVIERCEKTGEVVGVLTRSQYGNYFIEVPGVNTFALSADEERDWDRILRKHT